MLPDILNVDQDSDIQLYYYQTFSSLNKGKIQLNKNTFSFLREGTKEIIGDDNHSKKIFNDQFLIIKSGNCLMTEHISESNKTYKSTLLFFSDEKLLRFIEERIPNLIAKPKPKSHLIIDYDDFIELFVQSLNQIRQFEPDKQKRLLEIKFEEIMTYLYQREGMGFINQLMQNKDSKQVRLETVVDQYKYHKLSISEIAFLSRMSLSTFKREFAKLYHQTPMKWFHNKRLEHAAFLLEYEGKRAVDIFEEVGYETLSSFVQAFKKKYDLTPKQYSLQQLNV